MNIEKNPHNIMSIDWDTDLFSPIKNPPSDTGRTISFDPLVYILHGRDSQDFLTNRRHKNKTMYDELAGFPTGPTIIDPKYAELSEIIRKHFRNKLLMLGLRNEHISSFRTALCEILDSPEKLKTSHIPVLLRLPDFYQEDKEMEMIFDNYSSAGDTDQRMETRDDTVQFVKKFTRYGRHNNIEKYFFKNRDNNLYVFKMDTAQPHSNLMDFFTRSDREFGLRGGFVSRPETGYASFNFYHNAGNHYEFY